MDLEELCVFSWGGNSSVNLLKQWFYFLSDFGLVTVFGSGCGLESDYGFVIGSGFV